MTPCSVLKVTSSWGNYPSAGCSRASEALAKSAAFDQSRLAFHFGYGVSFRLWSSIFYLRFSAYMMINIGVFYFIQIWGRVRSRKIAQCEADGGGKKSYTKVIRAAKLPIECLGIWYNGMLTSRCQSIVRGRAALRHVATSDGVSISGSREGRPTHTVALRLTVLWRARRW